MQLNVTADEHGRSRESLWRVFLDLEYDWACAIGQTIVLDSALIVCNRELPRVWDANRVFLTGSRSDVSVWFEEVIRESRGVNAVPIVWEIDRLDAGTRAAMRDELLRRGLREQLNPVQRLAARVPSSPSPVESLTVIPARTAPESYAELCTQWVLADKHEPEMVRSMTFHLNDPKFEPLIALHEGKPIAMAGLQSRGDAGRVEDVYVTPDWRGRGVGRAMVERVLDLADREKLRDLFIVSSPLNIRARRLYERIGFESFGNYAVFVAPDAIPS